jgi:hypothetical protein
MALNFADFFTAFTGGGATALDSQSGAAMIASGDTYIALVFVGGIRYWYLFDATGTDAENAPDIIRPDDYATAGVWRLQGFSELLGAMPSGIEITGGMTGFECAAATDADHDVTISPGACLDSTGVLPIKRTTSLTKRLDASWAAGDDQGGLLNGTVTLNTRYDLYALLKDDGTVDAGWVSEDDAIGDYLPAGYAGYRYLRSHDTDADANIVPTIQRANHIVRVPASKSILAAGLSVTPGTVDHSPFIPPPRLIAVQYGCWKTGGQEAYSVTIMARAADGTHLGRVGSNGAVVLNDQDYAAWGVYDNITLPFDPTHEFYRVPSEHTCHLLMHAYTFKR